MPSSVTIHQITSQNYGDSCGKAFMNVDADKYGYILVWTSTYTTDKDYKNYVPLTFLIAEGQAVFFIQFDDRESARDYFTQRQRYIDWIKVICNDRPLYVKDVDIKEYLISSDDPVFPGILGSDETND
jgi:hypothetical protein